RSTSISPRSLSTPCDGSTRRSSPNRERRESSHARVQLAATETIRVRAATVGGDRGEAGRVCLGFIKFCARAKFGRADEADIAGGAAKCAATGAFAAKVDDAPSAREAPHPQGRARKATGQACRAAANQEPAWANSSLARALTTMTKAARQDMRTRR